MSTRDANSLIDLSLWTTEFLTLGNLVLEQELKLRLVQVYDGRSDGARPFYCPTDGE